MSKVKKYIFFFCFVTIALPMLAKEPSYTLTPPTNLTKPHYFIKLGAFLNQELAKKAAKKANISTKVIFMQKYYSLLSQPFFTKAEAKQSLVKIRSRFKDAYILTLYPQKETTTKKKSIPSQNIIEKRVLKTISPQKSTKESLQKAIQKYHQKSYEEAFVAFDRILIEEPTNHKAHLYYAKTLTNLNLFKEAYQSFLKLSKTETNPYIQKEIQHYLHLLKKRTKKKSLSIETSIGIGYDDNLNLTTNIPTTSYGPYLLTNDTNQTQSTYLLTTFKLTKAHKLEHYNIYTTLYSYNELFHSAKNSDLNYLDLSLSFIKNHKNIALILPLGYNTTWLDHQKISTNIYTNPSLLYKSSSNITLSLSSSYRNNHTGFSSYRDYYLLGAGIGIRYHTDRVSIKLSSQLNRYYAKDSIRYDINKINIYQKFSLKYHLFTSLYLKAQLSWERNRYQDTEPVLNYKREDKSIDASLSFEKELSKKSTIESSWYYRHNSSNINLYDYTKHNYTLNYKHKF